MEKNIDLLCIKSHASKKLFSDNIDNFQYVSGKIYSCRYACYDDKSEYYEVTGENGSSNYAERNKDYCNLNYFIRIDNKALELKLQVQEKIKIKFALNKIFKLKLTEYKYLTINKTYNFSKINNDIYEKLYLEILHPINNIKKSEFFVVHQNKIDYILSAIEKFSEQSDFDLSNQLNQYKIIINKVVESIKIQEEQMKKENIKHLNKYIKKQNELLKAWEKELDEIWLNKE